MAGLLTFDWMAFFLVLLTFVIATIDRAFAFKIRIKFQILFAICLYLLAVSQNLYWMDADVNESFYRLFFISDCIFRPIAIILVVALFIKLKRDNIDYLFGASMLLIFVLVSLSEFLEGRVAIVNNSLCVISCISYYYSVIKLYKLDHLTRLPIRHNLRFEMDDCINKEYDVALIDVDNFKQINDRYGHKRGDEALVKVVEAINKSLRKGCRLFRFGGDEFVVMSKKVSLDELDKSLIEANNLLEKDDLHFSYGLSSHAKGEIRQAVLLRADAAMYEHKKELKEEGVWDDMTGLYSYRGLLNELECFRKVVDELNSRICLVALDIERLSSINMAYGYVEGNYVIKSVAKILEESVTGSDFVGHIGSDEFVVVLAVDKNNDAKVHDFISQISSTVENSVCWDGKDYTVSIVAGSYFVDDSEKKLHVEDLVNNVLYSKEEYKESIYNKELTDEDKDYDPEEEKLVMDILDNNRLRYAFQPIVSAKDGSIVAYESLMRSDTEVMVSPLTIIKYAERNRRTYDIEKYTFFNTLARITEGGDFPEDKGIFINSIPGFMLSDEDYAQLKSKYGKQFNRMVIEITEQREVEEEALFAINSRRDKDKYRLAIDDYGSGYSNTNSLLRYMPQIVKLDRLLITGIERNAKKQFFVNSIISFARENDMLILAEGVETEGELKTVIRLGVDLIQGYFTAKGSFDIIEEIPDEVKRIIVEENIRVGSNKRVVYTASDNCEISSVSLAMEDYTKINASAEFITIVGSKEYTADMVIKIKDGANCHMTLRDVKLNSVDDEPCIDVGEGAHLTLNIEGDNQLNAKGIRVPEGSYLTVIGSGKLTIFAKGHECYGIGNDSENAFGKLDINSSGIININVDGENCVGIGGGICAGNSKIDIAGGIYNLNMAGVNAVGIGCHRGDIAIELLNIGLIVDFRVDIGVIVGVHEGNPNISIKNFKLVAVGSGTTVSGIGSIGKTTGNIEFYAGNFNIRLNGQRLILVGSSEGEVGIKASHVRFEMIGEGNNVLGFGAFDETGHLSTDECSLDLVINAGSPKVFGIVEEETGFRGALTTAAVNGEVWVVGEGK